MSKLTNRKAISKQQSKKNTLSPTKHLPVLKESSLNAPLTDKEEKEFREIYVSNNLVSRTVLRLYDEHRRNFLEYSENYFSLSKELKNMNDDFKALVKNYNPKKAKETIKRIEEIKKEINFKTTQLKGEWILFKKQLRKMKGVKNEK